MTPSEFNYMREAMVADLTYYLCEEQNINLADALEKIYNSKIFSQICNQNSGLFFQSPRYVFSLLKEELAEK